MSKWLKNKLRNWLGIEENTKDIAYEHKKVNLALKQSKLNYSVLRTVKKQLN
ncbi:hypothetical protein [Psychroserpens burtonensis]|uniref:hypothetical protein n=1 Tax=Psychroserpens burtonensis TaxID=49278 RepID=UPI00164AA13E|nr:hypothetical protein [Psychroserpens burtonensis]